MKRFPAEDSSRMVRVVIAAMEGDARKEVELLAWARSAGIEDVVHSAMFAALLQGRLADAYRLGAEARQMLGAARAEHARQVLTHLALADWWFGRRDRALAALGEIVHGLPDRGQPPHMPGSLALLDGVDRARSLMKAMSDDMPKGTLLQGFGLPYAGAVIALEEGRPREALDALAPAEPFDRAQPAIPLHRGLAYMRLGDPRAAAAQFRRALDRKCPFPFTWHRPIAQVSLARALAASGDADGARQAYAEFFELWKKADPDVPLLIDARRELAALPASTP
jgi:predicted Zn-dependent protease